MNLMIDKRRDWESNPERTSPTGSLNNCSRPAPYRWAIPADFDWLESLKTSGLENRSI